MSRQKRKQRRNSSCEEIAKRFLFQQVLFKTPDGSQLIGVVREVKDFHLRIDSVKGRAMSIQYDIHYKDAVKL